MQKLLIISDLHVTNDDQQEKGSSLISAHPDASSLGKKMFQGIVDSVRENSIEIDWVICPGDLSDKADKIGLEYAWAMLENIRVELGAKFLVGTAGNHDFDSRFKGLAHDPKANLQQLSPKFPGETQTDCDKYFARHYCIYTHDRVRIVNVNSSAYHGLVSQEGVESEHGRVTVDTIKSICDELKLEQYPVNILLTHHHLLKNDHIYDNDSSEMSGAGKLIQQLSSVTKSAWLVIHGHQHFPELDYGRGSSVAPIIISAGSLSAKLSGTHALSSPNQFYVLEIAEPAEHLDGWYPCGKIKSWSWSAQDEWVQSDLEQRIPFDAGFGCKTNTIQAADNISRIAAQSSQPYITLEDVYLAEPLLQYLLPSDLKAVFEELVKKGFKVTVAREPKETTFRSANG